MTLGEDVEDALNAVISDQVKLETLEKSEELEYTDPEVATTQEVRAIKNRLDLPKEDLKELYEKVVRHED